MRVRVRTVVVKLSANFVYLFIYLNNHIAIEKMSVIADWLRVSRMKRDVKLHHSCVPEDRIRLDGKVSAVMISEFLWFRYVHQCSARVITHGKTHFFHTFQSTKFHPILRRIYLEQCLKIQKKKREIKDFLENTSLSICPPHAISEDWMRPASTCTEKTCIRTDITDLVG